MEKRGFSFKYKGDKAFCKSPFSRDTNWSFCVYLSTNSFYDWSQGFGGSILDLVKVMDNLSLADAISFLKEGDFKQYKANYKATKARVTKDFEYTQYLTQDPDEVLSITKYAHSRGILNGYVHGVFHVLEEGQWIRVPSIGFLHRDLTGNICGIKFRKLDETIKTDKDNSSRFSARGRMMFYILEHVSTENFGEPTLYVVEGEANANSLWQYCRETNRNCVVISFGGVGNLPKELPEKYQYIKERKLIIDFDGSEELFSKRICLYNNYNLQPLKLILPKKEDINSLYNKGQMKLIESLL